MPEHTPPYPKQGVNEAKTQLQVAEASSISNENNNLAVTDLLISFCIAMAIGYLTIKLKR